MGEGQGTALGTKEDILPNWGRGELKSPLTHWPRPIRAGVCFVPGTLKRRAHPQQAGTSIMEAQMWRAGAAEGEGWAQDACSPYLNYGVFINFPAPSR